MTAELRAQGHRVNHKRIERLMRAHQITGITHRRRKRTTTPAPTTTTKPADLVRRDFKPGTPNQVWISDITYITTREGWLYLAVVLDLRSRRVLGYQMSDRINTQLVKDALTMASTHRRGHTRGVVFHSDRSSQYLFQTFKEAIASWGMNQSVGKVGSSADNAVAEAFFSTLKREHTTQHHPYPNRTTARRSIFQWLNHYNTNRRHSSLGQQTPNQYEHHHTLTT